MRARRAWLLGWIWLALAPAPALPQASGPEAGRLSYAWVDLGFALLVLAVIVFLMFTRRATARSASPRPPDRRA